MIPIDYDFLWRQYNSREKQIKENQIRINAIKRQINKYKCDGRNKMYGQIMISKLLAENDLLARRNQSLQQFLV